MIIKEAAQSLMVSVIFPFFAFIFIKKIPMLINKAYATENSIPYGMKFLNLKVNVMSKKITLEMTNQISFCKVMFFDNLIMLLALQMTISSRK